MKKIILSVLTLLLATTSFSQTVIGKWKTIDDETGKAKSIVEIYEKSGKIFGKISEILVEANKKNICSLCTGDDKNKPVFGMVILRGLVKDGEEYNNGKILDPKMVRLINAISLWKEKIN
jgi:sporulation protein YlmC with PRC-barrel domain